MPLPSYDVLVLGQPSDELRILCLLLQQLKCSVAIASSEAQTLSYMKQKPPYLIVLTGGHQNWCQALVPTLRKYGGDRGLTIVALTDFYPPAWITQGGYPGLDGFLVKPIDHEILTSVVHSAWARQTYCHGNLALSSP